MEFTVEEIQNKGKELGLSYTNALTLRYYEEILERVGNSIYLDQLWLKMENDRINNRLIFYMERISLKDVSGIMKDILKNKSRQNYTIYWDIWVSDGYLEVVLEIQMEKIQLPFKIKIYPMLKKEVFPTDAVYQSRLLAEQKLPYKRYPADLELAECLYEIMDKLELISSMDYYERAYDILMKEAVNGRHVSMNFSHYMQKKPIPSASKRWDTVVNYKHYSYMKKRWKNQFKGSRHQMPSWKGVIDLLDTFFAPIWKALEQDEIFFGDWMPHLKRYLD